MTYDDWNRVLNNLYGLLGGSYFEQPPTGDMPVGPKRGPSFFEILGPGMLETGIPT
jgi:hypothetical protein